MGRQENIEQFERIQEVMETSEKLRTLTETAQKASILYKHKIETTYAVGNKKAVVTVTNGQTLVTAQKLKEKYEKVAVLNFASATNPGGGVTKGSTAQEESICRNSNLYNCLNQPHFQREFYQFHRKNNDPMYTDRIIFSPGVTVIKPPKRYQECISEKECYQVDVISCAAPNIGRVPKVNMNDLKIILKERIHQIFKVATVF